MSVLKRYNDVTGLWEPVVVGKQGPSGVVNVTSPITNTGTETDANIGIDESAITVAQSQVTDLVSDLADKADNADFTGGTAGYTALSNGTAGLSYQPVSHNYIINGAFDIWQRGTSFAGISNDEFLADRWKQRNIDNASQSTDTPDDFIYSAELDFTGGFARLDQYIESSNCSGLVNKEITTSFWIKANQATIDLNEIEVAAFEADAKDDWSSETLTFINEIDISGLTADTWTRVSTTTNVNLFSSAAMNGIHLQIFFSRSNSPATEGTVKITGVQLEAGSIATPFKRNANSIAGELAACQRYYYVYAEGPEASLGTGTYNLTTAVFTSVDFPVTMRTAPSLDATSGTGIYDLLKDGSKTFDSFTISRARPEGCHLFSSSLISGTVGTSFRLRAFLSDAKVAFSAEL